MVEKRPRGRPRKIKPEQQNNGLSDSLQEPDVPLTSPQEPDISAAPLTIDYSIDHPQTWGPETLLKVHIYPSLGEEDNGDGGIRRVIEGQLKHLPKFGIEIVKTAEEADVIACHATIPSAWLKLYPNKTFVSMCHGMYWSEYPDWENWALKANSDVMEAIRVSDAITAPTEWVANNIRRHTSRPVSVIPHGVELEEWPVEDKLDYVLWNKTRPDPVCDPEPLNQVAQLLPDVQFVSTFGDNQLSNLRLTGKLPFGDAKKLILKAGVYLATTRETFGIGTLEALACGIPIVGFRYAGQAEFIEHEKDGWLVTPGDIEDLARGIKWALQNKAHLAVDCRAKAEQYTWEKACKQYADLFRTTFLRKSSKEPRTSIIVTAYDLEDYLPDALESVRNQTDQDWECIIVDDASPDRCGEIADSWAQTDPRFRVIHNETNQYLAEARNIGIRASRGRYILPLDADDMLAPNALNILADALDRDRSIHVAYGNVMFMEEDGKTPSIYGKQFEPGHSSWPYQFVHEYQVDQKNLLPYCSMFRKEAWEWTGGYRRRCRTAEDADMWTRFSSYGFRPRMVTQEDTLIYRNRSGSMSRTNSSEWIRWFSWSKLKEITPAGAVTKSQLPIPSLDPVIISVIIPVGPGHSKIVTDAVDSVDAQSFRNWECILINDTGKPLETELPSWVRVLETEGKTGPAHARNVGIKASRGRLFLPLDADDYLEPDALQMMFDAHQQEKEVIYTDFYQTDHETGTEVSVHHCDDWDPYLILGNKRNFEGQVREGMMHSVTCLTPKWAWEKIGGYDETLPAWEDWDFQISLGNIGVCSRRIPMPLFFYRKHTGFRRDENYASFEESKKGIFSKWEDVFKGRKELMACQACSKARKAIVTGNSIWETPAPRQIASSEAVLVRYIGNRTGATPYRGKSKTVYWFAKDDVKYVLNQDVETFLSYPGDFELMKSEPVASTAPTGDYPILVAPGQ